MFSFNVSNKLWYYEIRRLYQNTCHSWIYTDGTQYQWTYEWFTNILQHTNYDIYIYSFTHNTIFDKYVNETVFLHFHNTDEWMNSYHKSQKLATAQDWIQTMGWEHHVMYCVTRRLKDCSNGWFWYLVSVFIVSISYFCCASFLARHWIQNIILTHQIVPCQMYWIHHCVSWLIKSACSMD